MSLRGFHIVFITAAVLLLLWLAGFEFSSYAQGHAVLDMVIGVISAIVGLALAGYGAWFLKKSRNLIL